MVILFHTADKTKIGEIKAMGEKDQDSITPVSPPEACTTCKEGGQTSAGPPTSSS